MSKPYGRFVKRLCRRVGCDYALAMAYYGERYREVFGINHLSYLIKAENEQEVAMKKMFSAFFNWFLR